MKSFMLAALAAIVLVGAASVEAAERFDARQFFEDIASRHGD